MKKNVLLARISALVEPLLHSLNLELWGMEYAGSSRGILRIYIERLARNTAADNAGLDDKTLAATVDECAEASRLIGLTLDVEDPIQTPYVLEISSPGLERVFFKPEQLELYISSPVKLSLHNPIVAYPGCKRFSGILNKAWQDSSGHWKIEISIMDPAPNSGELLQFDWEELKKIRVLYIEPEKPGKPAVKNTNAETKKKKK